MKRKIILVIIAIVSIVVLSMFNKIETTPTLCNWEFAAEEQKTKRSKPECNENMPESKENMANVE